MADNTAESEHTPGCEAWTSQAPGQRPCICPVAADVPDDY